MTAHEHRLVLPEFGGSRASAGDLASELPEDLRGTVVVVDCARAIAITQSYSDELCKQLLQLRSADGLVLELPPERMAIHCVRAVRLRGLSGLKIIDRP